MNSKSPENRAFLSFALLEDPMSVEEIAKAYGLSTEAVREAIAYCESNPPELHQDFKVEEALAAAAGIDQPGYRLHGKPASISPVEYERIRERHRR